MKKQITLLSLLIGLSLTLFAQPVKVGFYAENKPEKSEAAIKSAYQFLTSNTGIQGSYLSLKKLKKLKKLEQLDVIWLHIPDTLINPEDYFDQEAQDNLRTFVSNGGGLLLSREAFGLINILGLESEKPEIIPKQASDNGYGRMLGFHAFRQHPVFDGLNGGAYILKPSNDFRVRNCGYFGNRSPESGKVVATDWDYIFLRENKKLVLEYDFGKGKILAVGAYMYFELPSKEHATAGQPYNVNRQHLEKFTSNCIEYLSGKKNKEQAFYWNYQAPVFEEFDANSLKYFPQMQLQKPAHEWQTSSSDIELSNGFASKNFWDIAGERLLVMGKENSGIEEVWAHPFMAFRDYEVGIKFLNQDTIYWLSEERPVVEINPESFAHHYRIRDAILKEVITVSPTNPQGVIHYEYRGVTPANLFIRFKTNQRIMWPYSHKVLGGMKYDFHEQLNAFIITDPSGDFTTILGFNKETLPVYFSDSPLLPTIKIKSNPIGHYSDIYPTDSLWHGEPTEDYIISGLAKIKLEVNDNLDVIFAAGSEGTAKTISAYENAKSDPEKIYRQALKYHETTQKKFLAITSPDSIFNEAYQWALSGADKFFVTTPGVGSSIVAGYGTTATGWEGEHEVNGRPGYSWYFGRDAVWSAFALLDYGDFEKVKTILEMLQKYQDLNGKIYHELSTSGFVHYDASDATPLYVILAGRYLKHSGDLDFISESMPHIKAALEFMYSTDTDGDGLIENTNVGHGWVEGGALFGSHTSIYLASCWAEALKESAYIFKNLGKNEQSRHYQKNANEVSALIIKKFWNIDDEYFYHGFKPDQTFIKEKSIMPSIPVLFGQIEKKRAILSTAPYGTNDYTSDWGARIISESSPIFNPKGYHTGSVWPLYTGWVALAEYKTGRKIQGFSHIMNNLLIYDDWAQGFIEEVLHGEEYKPAGVCHHQCWSQTMALQPAIEGMLGMKPDAINNLLELRPSFPANWDTIHIQNIRVRSHLIAFSQMRNDDIIIYHFEKSNPDPLKIEFLPNLPAGTELISKSLNGKLQRPRNENLPEFSFSLDKKSTIELQIRNGIEVLPVYTNPKPGSKSEGFRIREYYLEKNVYTINFEGKPNAIQEFSVYINGKQPVKVEKAELTEREGKIYTYRVNFPNVDSKYAKQQVKIFLD